MDDLTHPIIPPLGSHLWSLTQAWPGFIPSMECQGCDVTTSPKGETLEGLKQERPVRGGMTWGMQIF